MSRTTPMLPAPFTPDLLLNHADSLRTLARALLGDDGAAEDVVQDTWLEALERPPRRDGSLGGWLHVVTRNLALKRRRSESGRVTRERQAARPEEVTSTASLVERKATLRHVVDAVLALREPYQTVVFLRYFEDLSPPAIAHRLGRPEATVSSQLHRGLAQLRESLDGEYDGERGAWMGALAGLTGPGGATGSSLAALSSTTGTSPWLGGGLFLGVNIKLAVSGVVVVAALLWLWSDDSRTDRLAAVGPAKQWLAPRRAEPIALHSTPGPEAEAPAAEAPAPPPGPAARPAPTSHPEAEVEPVVEPVVKVPPVWRRVLETRLKVAVGAFEQETRSLADRPQRTWRFERIVSVTDEEITVGFGGVRPGISRTFDVIRSREKSLWDEGGGRLGTSDLEGHTVYFEWSPTRNRYEVRRSGADKRGERLSRTLLESLEADMGLLSLEPRASRSWVLEPEELATLFNLGRDLFITDGEVAPDPPFPATDGEFDSSTAISLEALLYEGILERAKGRLRATRSTSPSGDRSRSPAQEKIGLSGRLVLRDPRSGMTATLGISGQYLWDPVRRDVRSLALDLEIKLEFDRGLGRVNFAGTGRVTVGVEAVESGGEGPGSAVRVDHGRGTSYVVDKTDNICGVDQARAISNPAKIDYHTLLEATEEVKLIKRRGIDPESAQGIMLMTEARRKVVAACEAVRFDGMYCSIWKEIKRRDNTPIDDVTGQVWSKLAEDEGE